MCFICPVIGLHEPKLRPNDPKLKDWIDDEEDETRKSIWNKIRKNMYKYYLGNNVEFASFRKAAEFLFNRDYKGKKQIFVPEVFLTKAPEMIFHEKKEVEELLKAMNDDNLSPQEKKEKEKLKARLKTIAGEAIEKKVYDTLKAYYGLDDDQELPLARVASSHGLPVGRRYWHISKLATSYRDAPPQVPLPEVHPVPR